MAAIVARDLRAIGFVTVVATSPKWRGRLVLATPVQDLRFSAKHLFADANVTVARAKKAPPKSGAS